MSDILTRAQAIIDSATTHPDPERAMEELEAKAKGEDRVMFAGLWEALALKLNDLPQDA